MVVRIIEKTEAKKTEPKPLDFCPDCDGNLSSEISRDRDGSLVITYYCDDCDFEEERYLVEQ